MSIFISFEGIDGSGKTTQVELLRAYLQKNGHSITTTREPGGTALAEVLRDHLLHSRHTLTPPAELLLFGAARAQNVAEVIMPALHRGDTVLCDRFIDSSHAYQGGGVGVDDDFIECMNAFATQNLLPDLTILLDVVPRLGAQRRARQRGEDRIEERGLDFQSRARESFLELAEKSPERIVVLNGSYSPTVVHEHILELLQLRGFLQEVSVSQLRLIELNWLQPIQHGTTMVKPLPRGQNHNSVRAQQILPAFIDSGAQVPHAKMSLPTSPCQAGTTSETLGLQSS